MIHGLSFLLIVMLCSCGAPLKSSVKTDLGDVGNTTVANMFASYSPHCQQTVADIPHVMLTGFGLFLGTTFNISGTVVKNMSSRDFWPDDVSLNTITENPNAFLQNGQTQSGSSGAIAISRVLKIDGKRIEVCFVVLDVIWDLAAAIIMRESEKFHPDFILMTGRGGKPSTVVLEAAALNNTSAIPSYRWDGSLANEMTPVSGWIVRNGPQEMKTNWNTRFIQSAVADYVPENFSISAEVTSRTTNNYICNNVTYVVLTALSGRNVILAGDRIAVVRDSSTTTKAAFLHFPTNVEFKIGSIFSWQKFIAKILVEIVN